MCADVTRPLHSLALLRNASPRVREVERNTIVSEPGDEKAAKKFALVAEAHDVLSDPTKRRQYDQTFGKPQRRPQPGGFGGGGFGGSGTDSA